MKRNRILTACVLALCVSWMLGGVIGRAALKPLANGAPDAAKLGWRLATQAWTFRNGTLFEAMDKTASLGIKYLEAYPGQKISKDINEKMGPGMSAAAVAAVKAHLKKDGLTLVNFGVTKIPSKEVDARKLFDWARRMGLQTIVTESRVPFLDKLCNEYKINIAYHNHPYSWSCPPDKLLAYLKDKSHRMGACCDTGHWMRKNIKPLDGVKILKGRIICLHLKDLNKFGNGHDVIWGTGQGDLKDVLVQFHKQGFKGVFSMEYEYKYTMADLAACVKFFNDTAKEIAAEDTR